MNSWDDKSFVMIQFLKNLAMMGGMLYIVVHAPDR